MSRAVQCDVCKGCFAPEDMAEGEIFVTFREFYDQDASAYAVNKYLHSYENKNLCPECSKRFYKFMKIFRLD